MEATRVVVAEHPLVRRVAAALRAASPGAAVTSGAAAELAELARAEAADLVIVDAGATDAIAAVRSADPALPVVAVAETGDLDAAVAAVRAGASDFLVLGARLDDRVRLLLDKLRGVVRLRREHERLRGDGPWALLGDSAPMRELRGRIARLGRVPRPVLVTGERGTGKELVARALHEAGGPGRPLVVVNCAAFSDALLESELFGHEKGAYTGADRQVPGKFELAHGGTLFLDEIACMSLPFQQKVLRVVEYGVSTRVGGTREAHTSARIVAATNADLEARIAAGAFLPDLYDRLAFDVLRVPSLRERREDVPLLARHFLDRFRAELPDLRGRALSPAAIDALLGHPFPGNVRELKHVVERAALRGDDGPIEPAHLALDAAHPAEGTLDERVDAYRRAQVEAALRHHAGNQAAAARALGLTYDQLRHWVRTYGLRPRGR